MLGFIDTMRAEGRAVESICRVLREQGCQIAARTCRAWERGTCAARTVTDAKVVDAVRAGDLLNRDFTAPRPDHTWVMDFTYVRTLAGWVCVAFIVDVFSQRIVAWHAQTTRHVEFVMIPLRMEAINGLHKAECIRTTVFHDGPYKTIADVGYATAGWVDWHSTRRLHSSLGYVPPAELENAHYATLNREPQPA